VKRSGLVRAVLVTLLLAGCARSAPAVAEAGGERVTEHELHQEEAVARVEGTLLVPEGSPELARFYDRTVQELVDRKLLRQEAERRGLRVPDDYVEAQVAEMRAKYGQEGFRRLLERYRMTEEDFRRRVRELELVRLLRSEVERSVRVSEDEVRRYYREHLKEYTEPRRARVRILVFGDREAAQRARRDLEAGRRTFQDLAPSHRLGTDPQAFHEVVAGRDPDLEPLVFGAAPGRVQGPVKVGALWVVFRVEQVFPERPRPYEQVRQQVAEEAWQQKVRATLEELVQRLRRERGFRVYRTYATPAP
jgi:parvulin-like peptidyl-prolyl isomerase